MPLLTPLAPMLNTIVAVLRVIARSKVRQSSSRMVLSCCPADATKPGVLALLHASVTICAAVKGMAVQHPFQLAPALLRVLHFRARQRHLVQKALVRIGFLRTQFIMRPLPPPPAFLVTHTRPFLDQRQLSLERRQLRTNTGQRLDQQFQLIISHLPVHRTRDLVKRLVDRPRRRVIWQTDLGFDHLALSLERKLGLVAKADRGVDKDYLWRCFFRHRPTPSRAAGLAPASCSLLMTRSRGRRLSPKLEKLSPSGGRKRCRERLSRTSVSSSCAHPRFICSVNTMKTSPVTSYVCPWKNCVPSSMMYSECPARLRKIGCVCFLGSSALRSSAVNCANRAASCRCASSSLTIERAFSRIASISSGVSCASNDSGSSTVFLRSILPLRPLGRPP